MKDELPQLAAPALCATTAQLLRACGGVLGTMGGALALLAAAVLLLRAGLAPLGPVATAALVTLLLLAPFERVLAWRVRFDAGLFTELARGGALSATQPETLDHALHTLGLRPPATTPRPLADRVRGARRLALQQAAVVALQSMAATVALVAASTAGAR